MNWNRLLGRKPPPTKRLLIDLPLDTWEVLRRTAAREGSSLEEWAAQVLGSQATPDRQERAAREAATERHLQASLVAMDREDQMELLTARAARGDFSMEQWTAICQRVQDTPPGEPIQITDLLG